MRLLLAVKADTVDVMKTTPILVLAVATALFMSLNPTVSAKKMWANSFLGKKAPSLKVETWLSDKPETTGKWQLIDFWATWCGPCRKAIPELNTYHKDLGKDLVVIGISDEKEKLVRRFKSPAIEYYNAIDTKARTKKALGVRGIPHVILVDPQGIVRWEGFPYLAGEELTEKVIRDLMKPNLATAEKN